MRFVAPDLKVTNLKASLAGDFTDHLALRLSERGLTVSTRSDILAVLSVERQKQLLGCADDASSCFTELAGALGADGIVVGTVSKVGKRVQVTVRIISAADAKVLATFGESAEGEAAIFDVLDLAAQKLVDDLQPVFAARRKAAALVPVSDAPRVASPEVGAAPERSGGLRRFWWIPGAVGLGLGVGAAIAFAQAASADAAFTMPPPDFSPSDTRASGQAAQTVGWILAGTSAACLLAAGALLLFGGESEPAVTLWTTAEAVGLVWTGRFP